MSRVPPLSSTTNQIDDGKARPPVKKCQGEGIENRERLLAARPSDLKTPKWSKSAPALHRQTPMTHLPQVSIRIRIHATTDTPGLAAAASPIVEAHETVAEVHDPRERGENGFRRRRPIEGRLDSQKRIARLEVQGWVGRGVGEPGSPSRAPRASASLAWLSCGLFIWCP